MLKPSGGCIPPVAPADVPAIILPDFRVVYLRSSVLAGRCLPAVPITTCGALGCLPPVGLRCLCLTAWGYIPPVVSPTLGGSSLCIPPVALAELPALSHPRIWTSTCGAQRHLPPVGQSNLAWRLGCLPTVL